MLPLSSVAVRRAACLLFAAVPLAAGVRRAAFPAGFRFRRASVRRAACLLQLGYPLAVRCLRSCAFCVRFRAPCQRLSAKPQKPLEGLKSRSQVVAGRAGAAGGRVAGRAPQPIAACQEPRAQARGSAAAASGAERCRAGRRAPCAPSAATAKRRERRALRAAPVKLLLCLSELRRPHFASAFSTLSRPRGSPVPILSRFWLFQNAYLG